MLTKQVIAALKDIHGKDTKRIFTQTLDAHWGPGSWHQNFARVMESVLFKLGVKCQITNGTANAVAAKLHMN